MRATLTAAGVALAAALFLTGAVAAQQFVPREENPEDFPPGPGRDDTFYACTACHGFKLVAQQGMNRRQWQESIELMVSRHNMPPLPPKEQAVVRAEWSARMDELRSSLDLARQFADAGRSWVELDEDDKVVERTAAIAGPKRRTRSGSRRAG